MILLHTSLLGKVQIEMVKDFLAKQLTLPTLVAF